MKRLFQPIDIASLVFFRLAFGILGFAHVIGDWTYYHLQKDAFNPDRFQFKYMPFEWLPTFHDPWMSLLIWFIAGCGLAVALGWRYRWTSWLFAFGFLYLFLLEKSYYLNHGYLFCWLSFIMPFLPAHRAWSVDVRRDPGLHRSTIPAWPVLLLCLLMGIVYFYGGLAKINSDWLRAVPLKQWMQADDPVLADLSRRFINRDFFRVTFLGDAPDAATQEAWAATVRRWLLRAELATPDTVNDDLPYYLHTDRSRHAAYATGHDPIAILDRSGALRELSQMADTAAIADLDDTVVKPYVSYPKSAGMSIDQASG